MSLRESEWKLDDLLLFEFVRSGGLPGAGGGIVFAWCMRVAMRGLGWVRWKRRWAVE